MAKELAVRTVAEQRHKFAVVPFLDFQEDGHWLDDDLVFPVPELMQLLFF